MKPFPEATEVGLVSGTGGQSGFGVAGGSMGLGNASSPRAVLSDRVPMGEVELQRSDQVHATDGGIGRVQGLLVNSANHREIHIVLAEGHFWGRKRVLIPISAVRSVADGVQLNRVWPRELGASLLEAGARAPWARSERSSLSSCHGSGDLGVVPAGSRQDRSVQVRWVGWCGADTSRGDSMTGNAALGPRGSVRSAVGEAVPVAPR